jgi:hypothetical protein
VAAVRDAYLAYAGSRPTDVWLMLGDNAYGSGTDAQHQTAVFDMFAGMLRKTVLWPTLGNHDGRTAVSTTQTGPYYNVFTLPAAGEAGGLASGTEAYYSFDYGDIHFVCLDSFGVDRSPDGAMVTWLASDLESTLARWIIAFWHHPPYSKGSHDSDTEIELIEMRQNALPILEAAGVDLVLSGHSHSYERSVLLDGHYGTSDTLTAEMTKDTGSGRTEETGAYRKSPALPHDGAVYVVAGSGGHISGGRLNHPAMYVSLNALGSVVVDVDGDRLDGVFLDDTGTIRDHFTLVKGEPTPTTSTSTTQTTTTTTTISTTTSTTATTSTTTTAPATTVPATTTVPTTTIVPTTTTVPTTVPTTTTGPPTTVTSITTTSSTTGTSSSTTSSSTTVAPSTTTSTSAVETTTTASTTDPSTSTIAPTTTTTTSAPRSTRCRVDADCDDADGCTADRCSFGRCVSVGAGGVDGARCALATDPSSACGAEPMDGHLVEYIAARMAQARRLVGKVPPGAPARRRQRLVQRADRALGAIAKQLATAVRRKAVSDGCATAVEQRIRTLRRALSDV